MSYRILKEDGDVLLKEDGDALLLDGIWAFISSDTIAQLNEAKTLSASFSKLDTLILAEALEAHIASFAKLDTLVLADALGDREFSLSDTLANLIDIVAPFLVEANDAFVMSDYSKASEALISALDIIKTSDAVVGLKVLRKVSDILQVADIATLQAQFSSSDIVQIIDEKVGLEALLSALETFRIQDAQELLVVLRQVFDSLKVSDIATLRTLLSSSDIIQMLEAKVGLNVLLQVLDSIKVQDIQELLRALAESSDVLEISETAILEAVHTGLDIFEIHDYRELFEALISSSETLKLSDVATLNVLRAAFDTIKTSDAIIGLKALIETLDTLATMAESASLLASIGTGDAIVLAEAILEKIRGGITRLLKLWVAEQAHILIYYERRGLMFEESVFQRGEEKRIKVDYRENGVLTTPTAITITIYDPMQVKVVEDIGMDEDETGKYYYDYTAAATAILGKCKVEVTVDMGGGDTTIETAPFWLEA